MGKDIEVSEWEIDKSGRRYRRIGNCVEYEPTILTTAGVMTEGQRIRYIEQERERKNSLIEMIPEKKLSSKLCPFRDFKLCRSDCVLLVEGNCSRGEKVNPSGKYCPAAKRNCDHECAFYEGGCKFF